MQSTNQNGDTVGKPGCGKMITPSQPEEGRMNGIII
jgi:hypothetical protein